MRQPANRPRLFSAERWRASRDLRVDVAYIVVALAILAGISAFDQDVNRQAAPQVSQPASR
jgi:hypothetical protein